MKLALTVHEQRAVDIRAALQIPWPEPQPDQTNEQAILAECWALVDAGLATWIGDETTVALEAHRQLDEDCYQAAANDRSQVPVA